MNLIKRFFGRTGPRDANSPVELVAAPNETGVSLQILFDGLLPSDSAPIQARLRRYHRSMSRAVVEFSPGASRDGNLLGMAGWGPHVVRLVGIGAPMPPDVVELCVAAAHYPQPLKTRARSNSSHLILYYNGRAPLVLDQYVALAGLCGCLADFGASVVLNESAHTSFPADALSERNTHGDMVTLLTTLPLPILYCGFVKYEVTGVEGVWMRTHGAHIFGLPDLAVHAQDHSEGQEHFDLLTTILNYMRESGARIEPGHTMEVGPTHLRFRAATPFEPALQGPHPLLVLEVTERE